MLLPGPILWLFGQIWGFAFVLPAVMLLVVGWVALGADISAVPRRGGPAYKHKSVMLATYGASWIGLILGLGTVSLGVPDQMSIPHPPYPGGIVLSFPYIPSLYTPVVLLQAVVFGLGRRYLSHRGGVRVTNAGIVVLVVISALTLSLQALGLLWPWAFLLAAALAIGYFLIGRAWLVPPVERASPIPARAGQGGS